MSTPPRMHPNQIDVDESLVCRLLQADFPQLTHLPLRAVPSWGTVNAVFRLGAELVVRVPIQPGGGGGNERECAWLGPLALSLPVAVPRVIGCAPPRADFPEAWSVLSWLDGETPGSTTDSRTDSLVDDLAALLLALRTVDPAGAPAAGRGPVHDVDAEVREAIGLVEGFDRAALTAAWTAGLRAARYPKEPVWVHRDLLPGNVLLAAGRLAGVIDFGGAGIGDPACDLMIAWHLLSPRGRSALRHKAGIDDDTWLRGRAWALAQGLIALPYYAGTNHGMATSARHVIAEVLTDRSTVTPRPQRA